MSPAVSDAESSPGALPESPKDKVKFLCSHGGKILPRPADGHLKYVGGETRVFSVPRDICFSELMKKLTYLIEGEMLLKYQLMPEDLDALVSVKSDEDLRHMFEEYDRHESLGTPRLRTFLFPANPLVIDSQMGYMDRHSLEQRYINSINGIICHPNPNPSPMPLTLARPTSLNIATFSISSACSSPRSPPEAYHVDGLSHDIIPSPSLSHTKRNSKMPKVQSSPSLYNLGCQPPSQTTTTTNYHHPSHQYHHYQNQRPAHHFHHHQPSSTTNSSVSSGGGYQCHKPPLDKGGPEHLLRARSTGLADYHRFQVDQNPYNNNYSPTQLTRSISNNSSRGGYGHVHGHGHGHGNGHVCSNKCLHMVDDYGYGGNGGRYERAESVPGSPVPQSPRQNSGYTSKGWESIASLGHI